MPIPHSHLWLCRGFPVTADRIWWVQVVMLVKLSILVLYYSSTQDISETKHSCWQRFEEYVKWKLLGCVWLFAIPWTIQSMEFSRPEYWNGQTFPFLGDHPNPGIQPRSSSLQVDSLPAEQQPLLLNGIPGHQAAIERRQSKDTCIICIPDMATSTDMSMATHYLNIQPLNGVITVSGKKVCTWIPVLPRQYMVTTSAESQPIKKRTDLLSSPYGIIPQETIQPLGGKLSKSFSLEGTTVWFIGIDAWLCFFPSIPIVPWPLPPFDDLEWLTIIDSHRTSPHWKRPILCQSWCDTGHMPMGPDTYVIIHKLPTQQDFTMASSMHSYSFSLRMILSFWLPSFWMAGSRFIHVISSDSVSFLLMAE